VRHWAYLSLAIFGITAPGAVQAASLTILAEDASEPFSRPDGSGYANDIVRAAFQAAHIDLKLDIVPYARCKRSLEQGATPACFAMSRAPDIRNNIVFSDQPIFEVYADVFRNRSQTMSRAEDFRKGAVVGIVNAYEYPQAIYQLANRGVVLERDINESAILNMLARGRLDAAVVMTSDFLDGQRRLSTAGVAGSVAYAFRSGTMKSYIGFSLLNPQGELARKAFNDGYRIIVQNHIRDQIRAKWMKSVRQ
jgi:polar amino acid transport system substrate-binding protein